MKDRKHKKLARGVIYCCISLSVFRAPITRKYSLDNAHSHNDYKQEKPFFEAYNAGFGSMEADIYIRNGRLLVAHEEQEIDTAASLENLYLNPLSEMIKECSGTPYRNRKKQLQLLIELKESPETEIDSLGSLLKRYPDIANNKNIHIVFTGITPSAEVILHTPNYMFFDFAPETPLSNEVLSKIAMFSDDFHHYTKWDGRGEIPAGDLVSLEAVVRKYHALHKKVRFWNTPDNKKTWQLMEDLGVDYINTDQIRLLAHFLNAQNKHSE